MASGVIPGRGKVVNFKQSSQSRKDMLLIRKLIGQATENEVAAGMTQIVKLALRFAASEDVLFWDMVSKQHRQPAVVKDE